MRASGRSVSTWIQSHGQPATMQMLTNPRRSRPRQVRRAVDARVFCDHWRSAPNCGATQKRADVGSRTLGYPSPPAISLPSPKVSTKSWKLHGRRLGAWRRFRQADQNSRTRHLFEGDLEFSHSLGRMRILPYTWPIAAARYLSASANVSTMAGVSLALQNGSRH